MSIIWIVLFLLILPYSVPRLIKKRFPTSLHQKIQEEISILDQLSAGKSLAVQDVLGPHFNRKLIHSITYSGNNNCAVNNSIFVPNTKADYIVLARDLNHYNISDFDKCIRDLKTSKYYKKSKKFKYITVYHKTQILRYECKN